MLCLWGMEAAVANDLGQVVEAVRQQVISTEGASAITKIEERALEAMLDESRGSYMSLADRHRVVEQVVASLVGMDVLEPLIQDASVDEIMVMGPDKVYTERHGRLVKEDIIFHSTDRLMDVVRRIALGVDRQVNQSFPIADLRIGDGSRVNVVLPPVSLDGPVVTIRKFSPNPFTLDRLLELGSLTEDQAILLRKLVQDRRNVFVSGGTGTGKTSLLNALSAEIPGDQRVVTIEDSAELRFSNVDNLVRLECRTANVEGQGAINMDQLIRTALRLRPDRIIVGEVRGGEVVSMLQAMNTGHMGSMSTGHGNSPQDMLHRLETMFLMGMDIPLEAVRRQVGSAIDYIVHLERTRDHGRRVSEICQVVCDGEENRICRVC